VGDLTCNRLAIRAEARRRFEAKGRFAAAHGGFARFLKDAFGVAKRVRADMAAGGLRLASVRLPSAPLATPLTFSACPLRSAIGWTKLPGCFAAQTGPCPSPQSPGMAKDGASHVRIVPLMLRRRLRKLESQINTHHDIGALKAPRP
jgi:hypothetical protein